MSVKHRRTWLTAAAALSALSLGLTACGGGGSTTGEAEDSSAPAAGGESTAAEETTDETNASGEVIELDFMHRFPDGEGMTPVADTVARWNEENPDIQVTSTKFDGEAPEMVPRLEADFKAGNAPCVAFTGYGEVPELYVKGMLEDVSGETEQYKGNYSEGAYNLMKAGETMTGLPTDVGPLVFFYDEAQLKELGIEVPTDLESYKAAAKKAKESDKYLSAFTPDEALYWLSSQAAAAGDQWFTAENDEWVVNTTGEGTQRVAEFWQSMIDDETTLVEQRWGDGFTQALVDGKLIGHIGAAWEAGFLLDPLDGTDREGTWRVAQLPDFGAGQVTGPDGGSGLSVMKGCEHPAEAVKFIDWFNNQTEDLATQGTLTATTKAVETPEKMLRQFGGQDVLAEMQTASQNLAVEFAYIPGFSTLSTMNQVADEASTGKAKVADIFTTADESAVKTLKDLGLPVKEG